ncbi:hypothetical protein FSP39_021261 [Pinctada imbricata]|uniref:Uncharacterized protein n=1 Tax=Pinctada imbricata TaxID=66713 RepID=A0AA88YSR2_PINIB|nr:hypothetical protein FSP39_021261 [Pinctada imbricata]
MASGEVKNKAKEVTNNELKEIMTSLIDKLDKKIESRMKFVEETLGRNVKKLETFENDIADLKVSMGNQDQRIIELETKESEMTEINSLLERIEKLENVIEYNEYRSRKYNVLLYGIKKNDYEDVNKVVTGFLINELKIPKEEIESMIICNAHRIPRHQSTLIGEDD